MKNTLTGILAVAAAFLAKSTNAQLSTVPRHLGDFECYDESITPTKHVKVKSNKKGQLKPEEKLADLQKKNPKWTVEPLFTLSNERLKELSEVKVEEGLPELPDLTLWYRMTAKVPTVADLKPQDFADTLGEDDIFTDVVIPTFDPPPAQVAPAVTSDVPGDQGYLREWSESNNGIDAEYSWTIPGGNGEGVTIYDVEYAWNKNHEDLERAHDVDFLVSEGDIPCSPFNDNSHGTAVLGELFGTNDDVGVTGISHGADVGMVPQSTTLRQHATANAILLAVDIGKPGDVILLEMQRVWTCGNGKPNLPKKKEKLSNVENGSKKKRKLSDVENGYGPAEWDLDVFEATQVAVANGIIVVAVAGNGNVDLDHEDCEGNFNRETRDSGAIIVGSGGSGVDSTQCTPARTKIESSKDGVIYSGSSYGKRVDVQGWGECIATTGRKKKKKDTTDPNTWYRTDFSGTSGASPFVAGAAANIQAIAKKKFGGKTLTPRYVRKLLTDTGIGQVGDDDDDDSKHIGPLVNLRAAIDELFKNPPAQFYEKIMKSPTEPPMESHTTRKKTKRVRGKPRKRNHKQNHKTGN